LARGVQAVHHRHGDVQDDQVWTGFLSALDGFPPIGGLVAHFKRDERCECEAHTLPDTCLIVGYENSQAAPQKV
jgi:hypothetical protein